MDPVLIDPVAIADQDARPLLDQVEKGLFGAMRMNEIEGHRVGAQGPQPLQGVLTVPRRFINIADRSLAGQGGNGFIVRQDRVGGPVDDLLYGAQTDRNLQDRVAEILNEASGGAVHASECRDEGGHARAIAGLMRAGHLRFEDTATTRTLALLEDEMGDVYLDRGQLDDLMGVIGRERDQLAMTTRTRGGLDDVDLGRAEQGGTGAAMAGSRTALAPFGLSWPALGLGEGRIRRWRLT